MKNVGTVFGLKIHITECWSALVGRKATAFYRSQTL